MPGMDSASFNSLKTCQIESQKIVAYSAPAYPDLRSLSATTSLRAYPELAPLSAESKAYPGLKEAAPFEAYPQLKAYPAMQSCTGQFVSSGFTAYPALEPVPTYGQVTSLEGALLGALPPLSRPLKLASLGPTLVRGGAEQWLIYLQQFLDPRRFVLTHAIATHTQFIDPEFTAELKCPVSVGTPETIQRVVSECDVLLSWGLQLNPLLEHCRPRLCLFIAHGDGPWTRERLLASEQVVDHVVAVSQRVKDASSTRLPCSIIHNGVDAARLAQSRSRDEVRTRFGFSEGDFVLGYMGRFSGEKRPAALIHALSLLPRNFKGLFVGWGAMKRDLMELANDLIPGRYAFTTAAHHLGDFYRAMDAKCLVSDQEGYSLALLEAMFCERPVIATPVGSVPEIIQDRINGIVVDGSPQAIASAASTLAAHPRWKEALGQEAFRFAEAQGHASQMVRKYDHLIATLWNRKFGSGS